MDSSRRQEADINPVATNTAHISTAPDGAQDCTPGSTRQALLSSETTDHRYSQPRELLASHAIVNGEQQEALHPKDAGSTLGHEMEEYPTITTVSDLTGETSKTGSIPLQEVQTTRLSIEHLGLTPTIEPETLAIGHASLLALPRELRDLMYSELSAHRVRLEKPTWDMHGYVARGHTHTLHQPPLMTTGEVQARNIINKNLQTTLRLICQQVRAEVDDFSEKTRFPPAELDVTCWGARMMPVWSYLPLLRCPNHPIDVNVTLRLHTYDAIMQPSTPILGLLGSLIARDHDILPGLYRSSGEIPERACMSVRVLRLSTRCDDIYTPAQFSAAVKAFQSYCAELDTLGWYNLSQIIDINGLRINTKSGHATERRYWYAGDDTDPASASMWDDEMRIRPDWEID